MAENKGLSNNSRIDFIDQVRGVLMALMALDHVMAFVCKVHFNEFWATSMPDYGESLLSFFTRYVSHLCAPGFAFLMGAGMALFYSSRLKRGWSMVSIFSHFWLRGFILISMSLSLENFFWNFGFLKGNGGACWYIFLSIIFTLGVAMVLTSLVLRFPNVLLASMALVAICVTPLMVPTGGSIKEAALSLSLVKSFLFVPWEFSTFLGWTLLIYPIVPWLAIVFLGVIFGRYVSENMESIMSRIHWIGLILLLAFVVVRFSGVTGNINDVAPMDMISFLSVTKYPPSPAFILSTLGWLCLLLAFFFRYGKNMSRINPLAVFGRVPFAFYIIHIGILSIVGQFLSVSPYIGYVLWVYLLVILYPICRIFGDFKFSRRSDSLWRFF